MKKAERKSKKNAKKKEERHQQEEEAEEQSSVSDEEKERASTSDTQSDEKTSNTNRRRVPDTRSEVYSRSRYRKIVSGYDMDADSDTEVTDCVAYAPITDHWRQEYGYGVQELSKPDDLPKIVVEDDGFHLKPRANFEAPEKRIACNRDAEYYNSRIYEDGHTRDALHYDITAHDVKWLECINKNRKLINGETYMTSSQFVRIMEALEEETFIQIHNHLLDSLHVIYTDSTGEDDADRECDVCRVTECDEDDDMVYCDNCNTCVHLLCAGLDGLPSGDWTCEKCEFSGTTQPPCILCPALGGSMTYNKARTEWAHHSCALFVPEVKFLDDEHRAPMTNVEILPDIRFTQLCAICDTKLGACITCSHASCEETYHIGCALRAGCVVRIEEVANDPEGNVAHVTYCHRHSIDVGSQIRIAEEFRGFRNPWLAKLESVFYVLTSYEDLAKRLEIEEIAVSDVYEYWKQKRIEHGAALIPHLHGRIRIMPTTDRISDLMSAGDIDFLANRAAISSGMLPVTSWPQNRIQFFRTAALMVTELRQLHLKRVGESMKQVLKASGMLEKREAAKRDIAEVNNAEAMRLCRKMCRMKEGVFDGIQKIMGYRMMSKCELKTAKNRENSQKFMLQEKSARRQKRKMSQSDHQDPSSSKTKKAPHLTSPLRPRNQHPPLSHQKTARVSSISPGGAQNTRNRSMKTS